MGYVAGLSKAIILGRLGEDPKFSKGRGGQIVARLTVCVNTSWKDKHSGEWKEKAEWFHVNAWRHLAEQARRRGKKGVVVYVEGEPRVRKWVGKDGVNQERLEIRAISLRFIADRPTVSGASGDGSAGAGAGGDADGGGLAV